MENESFVDRLKAELDELKCRKDKLEGFITSSPAAIRPEQFALLIMQNEVMGVYILILERRLDLLNEAENGK